MDSWFGIHTEAVFKAYSPSHIAVLAGFAGLIILLYLSRQWLRRGRRSRYGRYVLAAVLVLSEAALNLWYMANDVYSPKDTLPLELCSISLYLCIFMLLFRSRIAFQIAYFAGIGGAIQALLTPALYYGYPHFRFIEFFAAHIAIILAVLYMVWVEGFRPTWKSILLTMCFLNVLLVIVSLINFITGGNYMFLARKPDTASLLDILGPYPWYLLSLEAVALVLFLILYAPFAASPRNKGKHADRRSVKDMGE
ncbi:YwaF family protein [Paenibacillus spongiae]|uniref:TIGR02206 family membrane protein n=1 Tax=Paenibacillus spongiae TaxID=2909671 RepID=A0ABY5S747_9BACL|nr:TIGR02206 family membrane protein [Paenibacillus spongiae]UVI28533.1 TIGR02206 family membrane protein [Paenibacillus spongiae]